MIMVTKKLIEKPQDAEKGGIQERPLVSFVSDATYHDLVKGKAKSFWVMCRYNTTTNDVKEKSYQVYVEKCGHERPEDVLLWYNKVQDVIE